MPKQVIHIVHNLLISFLLPFIITKYRKKYIIFFKTLDNYPM